MNQYEMNHKTHRIPSPVYVFLNINFRCNLKEKQMHIKRQTYTPSFTRDQIIKIEACFLITSIFTAYTTDVRVLFKKLLFQSDYFSPYDVHNEEQK